jgi:hypothetical protein
MGSFGVKCCLSGMDIYDGDPVVLLLGIKPGKTDIDYCGGWEGQPHHFQLSATPIFGSYNDYGWIENVDQRSWDLAMKCLAITTDIDPEELTLSGELEDTFVRHSWDRADERQKAVAWVHKKVWDSIMQVMADRPAHEFLAIDTTDKFKIEDWLTYLDKSGVDTTGHRTLYDDRYKGRDYHWISINPTLNQLGLMWEWVMDAVKANPEETEAQAKEAFIRDLGEKFDPEKAERMWEILGSNGREDRDGPVTHLIRSMFGWFIPFYRRGPRKDKTERLVSDKLMALYQTLREGDPESKEIFVQTQGFYNALLGGRISVRSHVDMVTSGQWSDMLQERIVGALASSMVQVTNERIKRMVDDDE